VYIYVCTCICVCVCVCARARGCIYIYIYIMRVQFADKSSPSERYPPRIRSREACSRRDRSSLDERSSAPPPPLRRLPAFYSAFVLLT